MNHDEAYDVLQQLYIKLDNLPRRPLTQRVLRSVEPMAPDEHVRAAHELIRCTDNEKHARHRTYYEGISRLSALRYKIYDIPSSLELLASTACDEIQRRASVEADMLGNVATATDKRRIAAHNAVFTWLDTRLRLKSEPVFIRPGLGLMYRLMLTDTKNVRGDQIRLPFPAFNVFIPPGLIFLQHPITKEHEVTHLSVGEGLISPEFAASLGVELAEPLRTLTIAAYARQGSGSRDGFDFMHVIIHVLLSDDEPKVLNRDDVDSTNYVRVGRSHLSFNAFSDFLLSVVTNLLLYLNGTADLVLENAADIERLERKVGSTKHPRKSDVARLKKAKNHTIYTTGTDIALDPELETAVREGVSSGARWSLTYKTLVRGHWRNQAHGPGREQRKMIWIDPHVRGPDFADRVATHTYTAS